MNESFINALQRAIGANNVLIGPAVAARYYHIWEMDERLQAVAVTLPRSTEDVSAILKICYAYHQPIVVHGGLTNLVNSTKTDGSELVISMEKMNAIEEIDPQSRTITVQAGVILATIQEAAKADSLFFPLNFGAKGSAQIGGVISTNAGGLRVFRYGMTRNLVLGLEAVLADGTILSNLKKVVKDNSGYDLKQLFIGTEGTLGVITTAVLKLVEAPKSRNSAWVGIESYDKVVAFLKFMDSGLAGKLSGFELVWKHTFIGMTSPPASVKPPLPYSFPYYVLVESLGQNAEKDLLQLQDLLEMALNQDLIADAAIAFTETDLKWFWTIREDVFPLVGASLFCLPYDISIPIPAIGNYVSSILEKLEDFSEVQRVYTFGHVADGNIHFLIGITQDDNSLRHQINEVIYAPLSQLGGSISAEHGIGLDKKRYLRHSRSPAEMALMKTLKQALDVKGLLNPGKII